MDHAVGAISPHLDDVVLSCGRYLAAHAGSVVVTVFAGGPPSVDPLPDWDRESGVFEPGDDVVGARTAEDERATRALAASTLHLDYWDAQYRCPTYGYRGPAGSHLVEAIVESLTTCVRERRLHRWLIPLGILHPDHQTAATACLALVTDLPEIEWMVYEDLPYAAAFPEERSRAIRNLNSRGFLLDDQRDTELADLTTKCTAVGCYRSQMRALGEYVDLSIGTAERVWRLS